MLIGCTEQDCEAFQKPGALVIGMAGGKSEIMPMLEAMRDSHDGDALMGGLMLLNKRYDLNRSPYVDFIAKNAVDELDGGHGNGMNIILLTEITGKDFDAGDLSGCSGDDCAKAKQRMRTEITNWLAKGQTGAKE